MAAERVIEWWEDTPTVAEPIGAAEMKTHLVTDHRMPEHVLASEDPSQWAVWHHAEHRMGHPSGGTGGRKTNALDHTHPRWVPKQATRKAAA